MTATATQVINVAKSQLGGYFPGSSPYGVWYGGKVKSAVYANAQFCAMGISWCANEVGALDIIPLHAYTPSGANWFKNKGQWHTKGPKRGDLVYFDFPGLPNRISHVGIVESVNSNGSINTIEFNTSGTANGNQRNGRTVARKTRATTYVVGYGRPKYKVSTPSKSTAKAKVTVNGKWDKDTIKGLQTSYGTPVDGVISRRSLLVFAIQRDLNAKGYKGHNKKKLVLDGEGLHVGYKTNTTYALQSYLIDLGYLNKKYRDGVISSGISPTVKALEQAINAGKIGK